MIDALPLLLGPEGYQISRSVRLRSSASAYFNRTPASATNRQTWTWSGWVKRGSLGVVSTIMGAQANGLQNTQRTALLFLADNTLYAFDDQINVSNNFALQTTQVFRDPSAWYHIVYAVDTTQATASNRVKLYVNGTQITAFSSATYPTQNFNTVVNNNVAQYISYYNNLGTISYFDGYLTEINFIDGLTPNTTTRTVGGVTQTVLTELGEFDAVTGVWKPARWTRSFGTNGFYLNFSDPSAATAAAIGKDYSGNGNNWTPNNISVTAGVTYDSMLDVPTPWADGGNGRGNYPVISPLDFAATNASLSNGNLTWTTNTTVSTNYQRTSMAFPTTGKWYVELTATQVNIGGSTGYCAIYVEGVSGYLWWVYIAPNYQINNGTTSTTISAISSGDVIQVAIDIDAGKLWFGKNGTWYLSGDPASGTAMSPANSFPPNTANLRVAIDGRSGTATNIVNINFGQRPFAYTPPSGFRALNTQNLPTPTIAKGNQFFNAVTYTGNGGTLAVTGVGFQPDFVWLKSRGAARSHRLWDAVRGATNGLSSDLTNAEYVESGLTAFNSDGFTLGSQSGSNTNAESFVAWNWKEGATQGFDIVTYTGDGVGGRAVSHSLGVAPAMIMIKARSHTTNWMVWHQNLAANFAFEGLNTTGAAVSGGSPSKYVRSVSSSTFTIGNDISVNQSASYTYVAYLFAEVAGFSRFGSYTGNGSADGPFVFCGFRPRWVMIKQINSAESWYMFDTARDTHNDVDLWLLANATNAETSFSFGDFVANGFKVRASTASYNASGGTYIFAAFAEVPFRNALAR